MSLTTGASVAASAPRPTSTASKMIRNTLRCEGASVISGWRTQSEGNGISDHAYDEERHGHKKCTQTSGSAARSKQVVRQRHNGQHDRRYLQAPRCPIIAITGVKQKPKNDKRDRPDGLHQH